MSPSPPFKFEDDALELWSAHRVMRTQTSGASCSEAGRIGQAYAIAFQLIATLTLRTQGKVAPETESSGKRGAVLAGLVSGLSIIEDAILGGCVPQAAALIRQELEGIAALEEIGFGIRRDGTTPNVGAVASVPSTLYGDLSRAAHFSHTDTLRNLGTFASQSGGSDMDVNLWAFSPRHIPDVSPRLLSMHTLLMLHMFEHLASHNRELHEIEVADEEHQLMQDALKILLECGMIKHGA